MFRSAFVTIIGRPIGRQPWLTRVLGLTPPFTSTPTAPSRWTWPSSTRRFTPGVWLALAIPPMTRRPGYRALAFLSQGSDANENGSPRISRSAKSGPNSPSDSSSWSGPPTRIGRSSEPGSWIARALRAGCFSISRPPPMTVSPVQPRTCRTNPRPIISDPTSPRVSAWWIDPKTMARSAGFPSNDPASCSTTSSTAEWLSFAVERAAAHFIRLVLQAPGPPGR